MTPAASPGRPGLLRLAALALALLAGCGGGPPGPGRLDELVAAGAFAVDGEGAGEALRLPAEPRTMDIFLDHELRPAVVLPAGSWSWRTRVPAGGRLQVGLGVAGRAPIEATITLERSGSREVLEVARGPGGPAWLDFGADLSRYQGQEVVLELTAIRGQGPAGDEAQPLVAWAPVALTGAREAARPGGPAKRPNVLFILVDTLRYDHLTPYGYERDTSPQIQRLLADAGVVMEHAYSQAPWTLPSAVSYMTSREPGEVLGEDPATFAIPADLPSLGQAMAELGYATAAFYANPALHRGNGFSRGFTTYYAPEGFSALGNHAGEINRRAIPWLQAHRDRPFFLYVHYIDPHDPYMNPDVVDGKSPYFDDPGGINGRWVHGVYAGNIPVDDVEREVRHFTALYDTEIRYVDRAIGELVASLPEEVLADTLVVLTADHGEELYDHGGWKHGHTLYEDQIHVPLLFRWDGRIPAGRRLAGTVRLLDLAPTLLDAAGGEAPAGWQGVSLLPALTGEAALPRLAAFAQDLQVGPLRAAAVLDGKKLILVNREEPFTPMNGLQSHIYALDMARLARQELYDLAADPGERRNLLAAAGEEGAGAAASSAEAAAARLAPIVFHHLDRGLPGLRVLADGLAAGARLSGELVFERSPAGVVPLFLGPDDRVEAAGERVRFELAGEALGKGFRILGRPGDLVAAALALDGEPLPPGRLRVGALTPFTGRRVPAGALVAAALPAGAALPGLRLWDHAGPTVLATEASDRTRESLRALGYVE
jgi:arylsulfatase A-like enzyme